MQRMKNISARLATFQKKALCLAVAAAFSQTTLANPLNPTVAAGSATFATNGNTLTVTNTPNAIINWQQFNIQQNETTRFVQQSAQSAVLNRIGGQNASQILGTLISNGRVFLVNPNGVMFGQGAVIDVAGLVASNLNLSDANFLANKLNFNGGGFGAVTNLGSISTPLGGSVYLVGSNVTNQGVITTPQGQVVLAAGSSVSLIDTGGPELSVTLTANGNKALNLGTIHAQGGRIDMFGALIEQAGILKADSVEVDSAGRIVLRATDKATVSGEISAVSNAGKGGAVQVLGNEVTLNSTAKIDVSGVDAGGTALIGGDYQGKNAAIQNAQNTTIEPGATIKADALNNGNGGKVIVWADDKTVFDGFISARGGASGGNGGFVETSGRHTLSIGTGRANTLAPAGKTGSWLLDPDSFCIYASSATECTSYATGFGAATTVSVTTLDSMLYGSNMIMSSYGAFAFLPNGGTFTVGSAGSVRPDTVIDVHASHIFLNGEIDATTNSGSNLTAVFSAQYGGAGYLTGTSMAGMEGLLAIGPLAKITTYGGSIEFSANTAINFNANAIASTNGVYANTSGSYPSSINSYETFSLVTLSAPVINKGGNGTGYIQAPRVRLATSELAAIGGSTTSPDIRTDGLGIANFYGGSVSNMVLGAGGALTCPGSGTLCITDQLSNVTGLSVSHPKIKFAATNDGVTYGGTISLDPNNLYLGNFGNQSFYASTFTLTTQSTFVASASHPSNYGTAVYAGTININGSLDFTANNRTRNFRLDANTGPGVINLNAVGNTLRTPGSVAMYGSQINLNGVGEFSIQAGQDISINTPVVGTGGDLTLTAGNDISTGLIQFTNPYGNTYGGSDLRLTAGHNIGLGAVSSPNVYGSSDLMAKAVNHLSLTGNINWGTGVYGGDVELRAPSFYGSTRSITAKNLDIFTDHFNGSISVNVDEMMVVTYSSTTNLYLGGNPGSLCTTHLCLTGSEFSGTINYDLMFGSNRDIVVGYGAANPYGGYSISTGNPKSAFLLAGNDIILNAKLNVYSDGYDTFTPAGSSYTRDASPSLGMYARNKFTDNVAASYGGGVYVEPSVYGGHWVLVTGNAPTTSMTSQESTTLTTDPWNVTWGSDGPNLIVDGNDKGPVEISNSIISPIIAAAKSAHQILRFGSSTASENTTSQISTVDQTQKILQDTVSSNQVTDPTNKAEATLTVSGELKVVENQITQKAVTAAKEEKPDTAGKPAASGKDDKAAEEKKKAVAVRQEAKAAEEKKSSTELKREAQTLKSDGKKSEAEAKKSEGEAKKIEAEAKKSETETKKLEAEAKKVEVEAKKAEETGKKAEVEAKKHDSDAKQAANEAKEAKTPVAKASAESKKAEAESKKAEAESKKVEAEEKKVAAESKKSEVEHKKAETESKHKEAETKHTEAESKRAEAESKQAEAESKLALAEAKEAKTPQQKAVAEKRADEKRVEAIQKKAEANVKKEQAETKKAEAEAKKAESEYKKTEAEAKKTEADSKRAEGDAKKSESSAKKAESEGKKAEADSAKAKQEGKGGDEKKAEAKKQEAEQKKTQEEKKADSKNQEAEAKQKEADGKKQEAEKKRAEAETKKVEAEKKQAERREEGRKSFAKAAAAAMAPERAAQMLAVRHEFKTEALKPALSVLERNPAAANLPACGGGSDVCVPAKAASTQQIASQLPAPRIPTVSFLPQIERKIAVVVAINNYKDGAIPPLESAIPDGEAIGKLMASNLGYDVRVIRDGSKADIVKSLNAVGREVGPNDSVTVYYAGHGYQMPDKAGKPGEGYWIPADAKATSPDNWISNSDVSKLLANIPAKQVMLVSDSCYSGAFTKEQKVTTASNDPQKLLANRSVVVMSSGGEEPVSDEGKDGHSIFAWSLMQTLKGVDKFETGGQLYEGIRKTVIDEFPQVPQYGAATSAGHVAGGDYLFESRKY
jgi:filamentous hemagglutinin family protein